MCSPTIYQLFASLRGIIRGWATLKWQSLTGFAGKTAGQPATGSGSSWLPPHMQVPKACLPLSRPGRHQHSFAGRKWFFLIETAMWNVCEEEKEAFKRQGGTHEGIITMKFNNLPDQIHRARKWLNWGHSKSQHHLQMSKGHLKFSWKQELRESKSLTLGTKGGLSRGIRGRSLPVETPNKAGN